MNLIMLMGRLTKDPEERHTQSGKNLANFTLAVDRRFKQEGGAEADFFRCTVWGKSAEAFMKYVKKGSKVLITGTLQIETYTNRDGQQVYAPGVVVSSWEFAESKKNSQQPEGGWESPEEELPFA